MATREYYSKIFFFVSMQIAILRADMATREYYRKIFIFVLMLTNTADRVTDTDKFIKWNLIKTVIL
jgi:hypothetical protein